MEAAVEAILIRAIALDLSKRSTGWAVWDGQSDRPRYGSWQLGSDYTTNGGVFAKLASNLAELHSLMPFERIYVEPPIVPAQLQGNTTIQTIRLAIGLAATLEYFAHQYREHGTHPTRLPMEFNVETWRRDFIGRFADSAAKGDARRAKKAGDKRASARDTLKELTMARCRQLGMAPQNNDQGDAIGILTYGLLFDKITPPWVADEVLLQPLEVTA